MLHEGEMDKDICQSQGADICARGQEARKEHCTVSGPARGGVLSTGPQLDHTVSDFLQICTFSACTVAMYTVVSQYV